MNENIEKELDYLEAEIQKFNPEEDDFIIIRYDRNKTLPSMVSEIHNAMLQKFHRSVITLPIDMSIQFMSQDELMDLLNGLQQLIVELNNENKDN